MITHRDVWLCCITAHVIRCHIHICRFITTKAKFHEFIDSEWQGQKAGTLADRETEETCGAEEPETKKFKPDPEESNKGDGKRLRGQNKSRPHKKPTTYDEKRLCLSVVKVWIFNQASLNSVYLLIFVSGQCVLLFWLQGNKCHFADKCHFYHDVSEYMANKPADIGESCYLYDTFGKCSYGLSCRFAKTHTTPDFQTMENADLVKTFEDRTVVKNSLSKDLQNCLRKHSVTFKKSAEYLKTLPNYKDKRERQGNGKNTKGLFDLDHLSQLCSCLYWVKWHWQKCNIMQVQLMCLWIRSVRLWKRKQRYNWGLVLKIPVVLYELLTEYLFPLSKHCIITRRTLTRECVIAKKSCFLLQESPEKTASLKTVGPLTDTDVIKLRACEKKQVFFHPIIFRLCPAPFLL